MSDKSRTRLLMHWKTCKLIQTKEFEMKTTEERLAIAVEALKAELAQMREAVRHYLKVNSEAPFEMDITDAYNAMVSALNSPRQGQAAEVGEREMRLEAALQEIRCAPTWDSLPAREIAREALKKVDGDV